MLLFENVAIASIGYATTLHKAQFDIIINC